jgi:branched-chain amino acid transport system substrate-binding protein
VQWTNAHGGINGHPVQISIQDSQTSLSGAIQAAQALAAAHVMANVASASAFENSLAPTLQQAGIPSVGGEETAGPPYGANPYFFSSTTSGTSALYVLLKGAKLLGVKKLANIYCTETPLCAQAAQGEQTLSGPIGIDEQIAAISSSATAASYAAQCLTFKNAGFPALRVTAPPATRVLLLQQCAAQGWHPRILNVAVSILGTWLTDPAYKNFIGQNPAFQWWTDTPTAKAYTAALKKYYPQGFDYPGQSAQTWSSAQLFATVAKAANLQPSATASQVYNALQTLSNNTNGGASPPLTFTNGNRSVPCGTIFSAKNGKYYAPLGSKLICAPSSVSNPTTTATTS